MLLSTTKNVTVHLNSDNESMPSCSLHDNLEDKTAVLLGMFPDMSVLQLKYLLELTKGNSNVVCDILLEGLTVSNIMHLWKHSIASHEVKRISLGAYNPEHAAEELLSFYKSSKLNPFTVVRISIGNQPVIDTGGVRRQLYSDALIRIANNKDLFESTENGIRPVFRHTALSSGMFTTVGRVIRHSIIMDQQGFPYFSPACYYHLSGNVDTAISETNMGDVGSHVKHLVSKVCTCFALFYSCINIIFMFLHS